MVQLCCAGDEAAQRWHLTDLRRRHALHVITDRDIAIECVATGNNPIDCLVKDYMTANPITIGPDEDTDEAYNLIGREQVRRLCVMENGKLIGIISLGDLAVQALDSQILARTLARISQPVRSGEPVIR
jgi:signal-transduction protein with cAMP-binding, CBS, and nucleotidyltransferase domain